MIAIINALRCITPTASTRAKTSPLRHNCQGHLHRRHAPLRPNHNGAPPTMSSLRTGAASKMEPPSQGTYREARGLSSHHPPRRQRAARAAGAEQGASAVANAGSGPANTNKRHGRGGKNRKKKKKVREK